jgi:hypothetical protein
MSLSKKSRSILHNVQTYLGPAVLGAARIPNEFHTNEAVASVTRIPAPDVADKGAASTHLRDLDQPLLHGMEISAASTRSPPRGRGLPPRVRQPITPQRRGNNRAVSTERCWYAASVSGTPESYLSSGPRQDVRTPAGGGIAFPRISKQAAA